MRVITEMIFVTHEPRIMGHSPTAASKSVGLGIVLCYYGALIMYDNTVYYISALLGG